MWSVVMAQVQGNASPQLLAATFALLNAANEKARASITWVDPAQT